LAGVLGITGVLVVHRQLLNARTYQDAFIRADVYDRVYTEVLADPELSGTQEQLLGEVRLESLDPASSRILATNSLRWVLPPSTIRQGTETLVDAVIRYIRGDTDTLVVDIDLTTALTRLDDVMLADARSAVAVARPVLERTIPQYGSAIADFLHEVAAGSISDRIPIASPALRPSQVLGVLERLAGSPVAQTLRGTIDSAVLANDDRDALAAAMGPTLDGYRARVVSAFRARLDPGDRFDVVGGLTRHTRERRQQILGHLDTVRDAVTRFTPVVAVISALLLAAGVATLLILHRRSMRTAMLVVLLFAGLATLGTWWAIRYWVESPLHPATSAGPGTWNLAPGLRHVVRDVEGNLASGLDAAVLRIALVPVLAGVALAAGVMVKPLFAMPRRVIAVAVITVALVAVIAATVFVFRPTHHERTCNGFAQLCDRHYNDVVQAATHNSMSNPDVVQFWPEQDSTIREQLDAGIRTLLIDSHYWTAVDSADQLSELVPGLPASLARLTISLDHDRLRARDGVYLCHVHCVWGAQPLLEGLDEVRSFLAANPDAVVTLIVEDEISPAANAAAFDRAGLSQYLYTGDPGSTWPTLGEMIHHSQRLVVFAENRGSQPPWYRPAFAAIQDTPFGFDSAASMSCAPSRGPTTAPLFLINHWVSKIAPDRSTAAVVNTRDFIIRRADECAAARRRMPTFIAVDFSDIGDVVGAVDALNHVGG
jgi:hypothetical protein